jgi:hypothetical protein
MANNVHVMLCLLPFKKLGSFGYPNNIAMELP